jgi:hypothetical protein
MNNLDAHRAILEAATRRHNATEEQRTLARRGMATLARVLMMVEQAKRRVSMAEKGLHRPK